MKDCMKRLLEALGECGEAAMFYREKSILFANDLFAGIFGAEASDFTDRPIMDIVHDESVELIQDFIRRRAFGDSNLPSNYKAVFRSTQNDRIELELTVLRTSNTDGALLVIARQV
jgi:PAS domain S-box-containing protein